MLRKGRSFSNLLKASILSCSALMILSGVCYGQGQQPNQTTIVISRPDGTPNSTRFFRGGINPAVSGDGRTITYSAASNTQPAIAADRVSSGLEAVSRGNNNRLEQGQGTSVSADGGIIAFQSNSGNLLGQGQATGQTNIYFNIRNTDGVALVSSRMGSGLASNGRSNSPMVSGDGSFIVYVSNSTDISVDSQPTDSIYLFDRRTSASRLLSKTDATTFLQGCSSPVISRDGSIVAFISAGKIFVKRSTSDFAEQIPTMANQIPSSLVISSDGSTLAYVSSINSNISVVLDSITGGQDSTISINPFGSPNNISKPIALSRDGRFLAVATLDSKLPIDTNGAVDIYVYQGGVPTLVSLDSGGNLSQSDSFDPAISDDGGVVAFASSGQLTLDADASASSNIFAVVGGAGGIGNGGGAIILGPVCVAGAQPIAPDAIELAWGFPGQHNEQLKGFKVQVTRLEGSEYRPIAKVPADGNALYVDRGLKPKTKYNYRLWIENPSGVSYSVDFSAKTPKIKK